MLSIFSDAYFPLVYLFSWWDFTISLVEIFILFCWILRVLSVFGIPVLYHIYVLVNSSSQSVLSFFIVSFVKQKYVYFWHYKYGNVRSVFFLNLVDSVAFWLIEYDGVNLGQFWPQMLRDTPLPTRHSLWLPWVTIEDIWSLWCDLCE